MLGENSAFDVFGPQKGLSEKDIEKHKIEVERLITLIDKELVLDLNPTEVNSGAAGGLTFTLNQILGCEIDNGAKYFLKAYQAPSHPHRYRAGCTYCPRRLVRLPEQKYSS